MTAPSFDLLLCNDFDAVIDVRTPAEFDEDHLPRAINLPVLSNDERAEVGTLYAQSPFLGRVRGATLIARNIALHIEHTLHQHPPSWKPLVYCWRGGKRSGALVHILRDIGWKATALVGGYKSYRRAVIQTLLSMPDSFRFVVLCGPTGVGKTAILEEIHHQGGQTINLEALAHHRGSVLGQTALPQPSQKLFESRLCDALHRLDPRRVVFVEAEGKKIGQVHVPGNLMSAIRSGICANINAPMASRVALVLSEYAWLQCEHKILAHSLNKLAPFHPHEHTQEWHNLLAKAHYPQLAERLMREHYDPLYHRALQKNFTVPHAFSVDWQIPNDWPALAQRLIAHFDSAITE